MKEFLPKPSYFQQVVLEGRKLVTRCTKTWTENPNNLFTSQNKNFLAKLSSKISNIIATIQIFNGRHYNNVKWSSFAWLPLARRSSPAKISTLASNNRAQRWYNTTITLKYDLIDSLVIWKHLEIRDHHVQLTLHVLILSLSRLPFFWCLPLSYRAICPTSRRPAVQRL